MSSRFVASGAHFIFCALAYTFSLTPCFSWGLDDLLTRQPFQRLSADEKPLKAVARLRPSPPTLLKQGVNERAVNTAVRQRCLLVQKAPGTLKAFGIAGKRAPACFSSQGGT